MHCSLKSLFTQEDAGLFERVLAVVLMKFLPCQPLPAALPLHGRKHSKPGPFLVHLEQTVQSVARLAFDIFPVALSRSLDGSP